MICASALAGALLALAWDLVVQCFRDEARAVALFRLVLRQRPAELAEVSVDSGCWGLPASQAGLTGTPASSRLRRLRQANTMPAQTIGAADANFVRSRRSHKLSGRSGYVLQRTMWCHLAYVACVGCSWLAWLNGARWRLMTGWIGWNAGKRPAPGATECDDTDLPPGRLAARRPSEVSLKPERRPFRPRHQPAPYRIYGDRGRW